MKRTLIFSFILLNFGINLFSQSHSDTLKPKIKIIEEVLIGVVDENDETEFERYKTDTTYLSRTDKRFFNRKGKLIEWQSSNHLLMTEQFHKYKLNKNGDWINAEIIKSNGEINNMVYDYDYKNNLISIKTYNNEELVKTQENTISDNGEIVETELNEFDKNLKLKIFSSYNEKNKILERTLYDANNHIKERRNFIYNSNGKEIENIVNYGNKNDIRIIFEYDKNDNVVTQCHYNLEGKLIKKVTFEYIYDRFDNWISKKRKTDGVTSLIWERKIEYYE